MARRNPFSRALSGGKGETASEDRVASANVASPDARLRIAEAEAASDEQGAASKEAPSLGGESDPGASVGEYSLDTGALHDARTGMDIADDVIAEADSSAGSPVQTHEERLAARGSAKAIAPEDLTGASGDDHVPSQVSDLAGDPRAAVASMLPDRNPIDDPLTAAGMGLVAETANSRARSPLDAASGSNPLGDAINSVTPEDVARAANAAGVTPSSAPSTEAAGNQDAGKSSNVDVIGKGGAGVVTDNATYWDNKKGEVVNADQVTTTGKVAAEADMTTTRAYNKSEDAETKGGFNILSSIGEYFAEQDYQAEWGETEKEADAAHARRTGGGVSQHDPDDEGRPPTEAEVAFKQALRNAAGIRRISGDVDPVEDGTQASGAISDAAAAALRDAKSNEALVGNPGGVDDVRTSGRPVGERPSGLAGTHQGGDIDPLDDSAFTGATRGGDPRELEAGIGSAPLGEYRDQTDEADSEDEQEAEDSDDAQDDA